MNQYKRNSSLSQNREFKNLIDFRSDTVTLPSREMLSSIQDAKIGDDVYDEDNDVLDEDDVWRTL